MYSVRTRLSANPASLWRLRVSGAGRPAQLVRLPHRRDGPRCVCLSRNQHEGARFEPECAMGMCSCVRDGRDRRVLWLGALEGVKVFLAPQTWRLNQHEEDVINTTNFTEQPLADMEEWDEFLV